MSDPILKQIQENLIKGKAKEVLALCEEAVKKNIPVEQILNEGLISGMAIITIRIGTIMKRGKRNESLTTWLISSGSEAAAIFGKTYPFMA